MLGELVLGGLEVVRGDDDEDVDAFGLGEAGEGDGVAGGDAADVAVHRDAALDGLAAEAEGHLALFGLEGEELPGGSPAEDAIDAGGDQGIDESCQAS